MLKYLNGYFGGRCAAYFGVNSANRFGGHCASP